jgi:hypothetical protein
MFRKSLTALLGLTLLFSGTSAPGQQPGSVAGDRPIRVEIPVRSTDETYHLIPLDSTGTLLFFKSVETLNDTLTKWYFSLYDTDLNPVWVKSIPVRTGLEIRDFFPDRDKVSFLLLAGEKTKGLSLSEMILRLDFRSGKFTGTRYAAAANIQPVDFRVYGNHAYLGYNLKNGPAHIQVADLDSARVADFPLTPSGTKSSLTGFILDTLGGNIYATVSRTVSKNHIACDLLKLNFAGVILSAAEINTVSPMWEVRYPQLVLLNPDELLVIGTYAVSGRSGKNTSLNGSSGFLTCRFVSGIQTDTRLKNFLDLANFQGIFGEKDTEARQKKAQKKNKPANKYVSEVNLLVHPLKVTGDGVLFVGESYVPEYHPENFTEFDFYGRPYVNTYNVFDGYRYTSALVAGFDKAGNVKWDNAMEIRNLISGELVPKVNVFYTAGDTLLLCYLSEARIASKIIRGNDVLEKLDFSAMEQMNPEDKMLTDTKNFMVPWYGSFFLCYGYQEIKNINSSENKKRQVYYFSKVRFE